MWRGLLAAALFAGVATWSGVAAPAEPPAVRPDARWSTGKGFKFDRKETTARRAVSGVACAANAAGVRRCLAVFDEEAHGRYFIVGARAIEPEKERVTLLARDGELDAEGAATDGEWFYVTGSHSAKRSTCDSNPISRHVIRFRVDPTTGRGLRDGSGNLSGYAATGRLWSIMARVPELNAHTGDNMCLGTEPAPKGPGRTGKRGVNIEGLAVRDGRLYFGFRGPAQDGKALILAVEADALFKGGDGKPRVYAMPVGRGRAVRDLIAVSDGILVLAGPDDDSVHDNAGWIIGRWDDRAADGAYDYKALAGLDLSGHKRRDCDSRENKPEALAVLSDEPGRPYQVLVLSDGLCDGGPTVFTVAR